MGASPMRIIVTLLVPRGARTADPRLHVRVRRRSSTCRAVAGAVGGGGLGDFAIPTATSATTGRSPGRGGDPIIVLVQAAQFLGNWLARKALRR